MTPENRDDAPDIPALNGERPLLNSVKHTMNALKENGHFPPEGSEPNVIHVRNLILRLVGGGTHIDVESDTMKVRMNGSIDALDGDSYRPIREIALGNRGKALDALLLADKGEGILALKAQKPGLFSRKD